MRSKLPSGASSKSRSVSLEFSIPTSHSAMAAGAAPPASSSRLLFNPPRRPLLPPAGLAVSLRFRYKDTIPERFSKTCTVQEPLASRTVVACRSKGMSFPHLSAASSTLLGGDQIGLSHAIPMLPGQRKALIPVRASKNNPFSYRLPTMNEKPDWWYRILACVPYLLALQMSDTAFYVLPFLERYEVLESLYYYIPGSVRRLPWWFQFAHFYLAYLGVVRNNKWPHYLRFHVAMGFLLESALMVVVNSSNLMPLIHFQGTFGLYYWAAVGFIYIFVMLECVRCALAGTYVKLPLISDSAFIHTLFRVGGYQRPF